jgi:hypothetical protein
MKTQRKSTFRSLKDVFKSITEAKKNEKRNNRPTAEEICLEELYGREDDMINIR